MAIAAGAVVLIVVSGLAGAAAGATWGPGSWQWGDVPGWTEAVATVGALMAASVAAYFAFQANERERQRDITRDAERRQDEQDRIRREDERIERERRAHAELVAVWPAVGGGDGAIYLAVEVGNGTGLPIYEVKIVVGFQDRAAAPVVMKHRFLAPYSDPLYVPLGDEWFKTDDDGNQRLRQSVSTLVAQARSDIHFTDSAGVRWFRDGDGKLSQVDV